MGGREEYPGLLNPLWGRPAPMHGFGQFCKPCEGQGRRQARRRWATARVTFADVVGTGDVGRLSEEGRDPQCGSAIVGGGQCMEAKAVAHLVALATWCMGIQ